MSSIESGRVALLSLPWTNINEPALGLAILKASLDKVGGASKVFHLNINLLKYISSETYYALASLWAINDFIFSYELTGPESREQVDSLARCLDEPGVRKKLQNIGYQTDREAIDLIVHIRNKIIPKYLLECSEQVLSYSPTLIGLSCMFDQTFPSMALARVLRRLGFDGIIALGGYAVREPVASAILTASDDIDVIAQGAGEDTIISLARAATGHGKIKDVPNLIIRADMRDTLIVGTEIRDSLKTQSVAHNINLSPLPNYDDWFDQVKCLSQDSQIDINVESLPLELSRGCWWGQKNHCVFCGIAPDEMKYRRKEADIAYQQINALSERYQQIKTQRINDYIFPLDYLSDLVPKLEGSGLNFSCETKANLKLSQLNLLSKSRFHEIQPGIESFSKTALVGMKKGVSPLQNIAFLVHGKALNITVHYNILYSFPFDEPDHYDWMMRTLPSLYHLRPPMGFLPVQITRDAPLHKEAHLFGASAPPKPSYRYAILNQGRFTDKFIDDYCYYFERYHTDTDELSLLFSNMERIIAHWREAYYSRNVSVSLVSEGLKEVLFDNRFAKQLIHRLEPGQFRILRAAASKPISISSSTFTEALNTEDLTHLPEWIDRLVEDRLLLRDANVVLSVVPGLVPQAQTID